MIAPFTYKGVLLRYTLLFTLKFDCLFQFFESVYWNTGTFYLELEVFSKSANSFSVKSKVIGRGQPLI